MYSIKELYGNYYIIKHAQTIAECHQIQQIEMLLNAYESFKNYF